MIRAHASFHKCLTTYYIRVMESLYQPSRLLKKRFIHFESIQGQFYNDVTKYRLVSTNGFAINHAFFPEGVDYRISRFIRDPRDLVVSGYFYHLKGAEPWFRFKSPSQKYWEPINGHLPEKMPSNISYSEYLNQLSKDDGLMAEIEFRRFHFESLRQWPVGDDRIRTFRYENILGNEVSVFAELFDFYQLTAIEKKIGCYLADRYSLKRNKLKHHMRNPTPGQWKEHFTPKVNRYFESQFGDILERYAY